MVSRHLRLIAPLLLIAIPTLVASPASAQGRRGFPDVSGPQIDSQEIEKYKDLLVLDAEQLDAARQLQQAYVAELAKLGEKVREITDAAREEFRQTRDGSVWRDLRGVVEKFSEQRDALTASTLSDLRLLLTPEQDARWTDVEQFRRRRHDLVQGASLSGEGVDLIALTEGAEIPEASRAAVDTLLAQYAGELDRAILERDRARTKLSDAQAAEEAGRGDLSREDAQRFFEDIKDKGAAIRDLNRRYVRQIESEVGGDSSVRIEVAFQQASFPRVFSKSATEKAFEAALQMTDLGADRLDQIKAAQAAYLRDRAAANQKIAEAIEQQEMARTQPNQRGPGFFRNQDGDATRPLFESRRSVDQSALDKLHALLTPDQIKRLPEVPSEDWRTQNFDAS